MRYLVIFERASDGGYGAYLPDIPGCAAVGATLEETRGLIAEAVELHVAAMRADGETVPAPTTIAAEYVEVVDVSHAA
jgi:predicted RNase H-like HicB family nuclease